jgi:hypothetical protein
MSAEHVGTLAEEAAKLVAAMQNWGAEAASATADRDAPGSESDEKAHSSSDHAWHDPDSPECRWCPLCQFVRAAKATSPEVRDHLASAAVSLALAFKGLLDGVDERADRSDPVEKIDLDLAED